MAASKNLSRLEWVYLGAVLLIAAVLRLHRLGVYPFWHDEVHNLLKANNIQAVLFRGEFVSNHPPLFSILAATWKFVGLGDSEWSLRLLTVLLGVATVAMVFWAGRTLFSTHAGIFAAFLAAVSPFFVTHSQDFKEYMILPITGTFAVVALYQAASTNDRRWWAAYCVGAALACYSESFAGPLLIAVNTWFILQSRGKPRTLLPWVIANVIAFAAFAPYLPFLLRRADKMLVASDSWWIPEPSLISVIFYLKTLAFGYAAVDPLFKIALGVFLLAFAAGVAIAVKQNLRSTLFSLVWFAAPVALVYILSLFVESIFLYRAMLPYAIPFYLLIGVAWARLDRRWIRTALVFAFAVMAAPGLWHHYYRIHHPLEFPHRPGIHAPQDFPAATAHINEHWREDDAVVTAGVHAWLTMRHYGLENKPIYFGAVDADFIRDISAANVRTSQRLEYDTLLPREIGAIAENHDRVWYAYAEWERVYLPGNATSVWRWLDSKYRELDRVVFDGGELRLYDTSSAVKITSRDNDDGISADVAWNDEEETYRLVLPDKTLVAKPDDDRRGRLFLQFVNDESDDAYDASAGGDSKPISFSIENRSNIAVECEVTALASDALISPARFVETSGTTGRWRVAAFHFPYGVPQDYEIHTASAHFREQRDAIIAHAVELKAGTYDTFIHAMGLPGDAADLRANVDLRIGDTRILPEKLTEPPGPLAWYWIAGNAIELSSESAAMTLQASHLASLDESFCDVESIRLLRRRAQQPAPASAQILDRWPGVVRLEPSEKRTWTIMVDTDIGRVDIWALERGAGGLAYRVIQTYAQEND